MQNFGVCGFGNLGQAKHVRGHVVNFLARKQHPRHFIFLAVAVVRVLIGSGRISNRCQTGRTVWVPSSSALARLVPCWELLTLATRTRARLRHSTMPAPTYIISRVADPIFAVFIGMSAAATRINREEKAMGKTKEQTVDAFWR